MTTPTTTSRESGARGARRRPTRVIAFGIAAEDWDRLEALAAAELRDPLLQARWIVLQALRSLPDEAAS